MPDTSAAANDWSGVGFALTGIVAGVAAWIGKWHAGKDQEKSPTTSMPEVAGVTMALIEAKTQATIAKDTERTADACDALVKMFADFVDEMQAAKQETRDRTIDRRFAGLEGKLDMLLGRIDEAEASSQKRHDERRRT